MSVQQNRITIHNILETFFEMEESEGLFDLALADGTHYWDIIRTQIYLGLHALHGGPFANPVSAPDKSLASRVKDSIRLVLNRRTRAYLVRRKPEYLFITGQRIRQGSELIDNITDHLFAIKSANSVAIEIMNKKAISYCAMVLGRKTRIPPVAIRQTASSPGSPLISRVVSEIVRKHFSVSPDVHGLINEPISTFFQSRHYYRQLFRQHKPRAVVGVNNATLKGLFSVARETQVPVLELQHGVSSTNTILWSYPATVPSSHPGLSLPTAYLTFSDYWRDNTHFPVRRTISIGNDFFYQGPVAAVEDGILIVSAYMYHDDLVGLALELAGICQEKRIYYKLHPHQFAEKEAVVARCGEKSNIKVLSDEMELPELFRRCDHVVGVHSTFLYIALQAGKRVCLYKRSNYFWHEDIFKYVEVFDAAAELKDIVEDHRGAYFRNIDRTPIFFQPFDADRFLRALDEVEACSW